MELPVVASLCFLPGVLLSSSKTSKSIIFPALPSAPRAGAQHKINLVYSSTRDSRLSSRLPGCKETNFLLKHFPLDLLFSPRRKLRSGSCRCAVAAILLALCGRHGCGVPAPLPAAAPDLPAGAAACSLLPWDPGRFRKATAASPTWSNYFLSLSCAAGAVLSGEAWK